MTSRPSSDRPRRILFTYQKPTTFIETDRQILSEAFATTSFEYRGKRDLPRMAVKVMRNDLSFSWFALGHALAAVMLGRWLGKPSIVVVGGWDVASMPEVPYGAMMSASRRRKTIRLLTDADVVLAVSNANRQEAAQWVGREIGVVPLGVDTAFFRPGGPKEDVVLTVANVTHRGVIRTKGIDVFLDTAKRLPEVRFVLAGAIALDLKQEILSGAPPNFSTTDWLERAALREWYRKAKVYAQLSAHESFGLALAEAMACGCQPVVSDRGSLPEVVGPTGSVVPYGDAEQARSAIEKALRHDDGQGARDRIETAYPIGRRRESLVRLIRELP